MKIEGDSKLIASALTHKVCTKCKQLLPVTAFQKCSRDGYQSRCKQCRLEDQRAKNEQHNERNRRWQKNNPDAARERTRRYRRNHKEKAVAHWRVEEEIQRGRLPRVSEQTCARCGAQAEHYHHDSYDRPLDVMPLCSKCHKQIHLEAKQ